MSDSFNQRKKDVLSKLDKSNIGSWDKHISKLCDKINSLDNYYTTSSCSGRAILIIDQDKKAENLFVFVSHEKIKFEELKKELDLALNSHPPTQGKGKVKGEKVVASKNIKFKLEPCILHISCRTLEDAEKIYNKGKLAGWKKSGIIGMKNGITIELNSTEHLEFPIIQKGKILVDDTFLKIVVEEANKKLEKVWLKIRKLEGMI